MSRRPGRASSSRSSSSARAASQAAERELRAALTRSPGYVFAREQLARVEAARGRLDRAIAGRAARRRPSRCRSSSACSATCSSAPAGPDEARRQSARPWPRSTGCSERAGSAPISSPRSIAPTTASARRRRWRWRARRRADAAVDLRRRRSRLGARPGRPLRGGAALAAAVAPARHAGRAPVLPPWLRGGLRRQPGRDARLVRKALALDPHFSVAGRPSRRRSGVKRLLATLTVVVPSPRSRSVGSAAAHPLGNFTVNHYAGIEVSGETIYRSGRARPGRDPDLSDGRPRPLARLRGGARARARAARRRPPRRAARSRAARHRASRAPAG